MKLGGIYVSIGARTKDLKRGLSKARAMASASARSMALSMGITGAAAGLAAKEIIKIGANFKQSMAVVKGVTRATEQEFKNLTAIARKMGEETEWSASQSAQALKYLGMAGFSAANAIEALPGVLDLATAGNIDLARAADIASDALTAMGLQAKDLTRVNDVFVGTITRSNTNIEMMGQSFAYAAPSAKAFGYSIEELSAMIGMLANAGVKGSAAGTQLSFAFVKVASVFKKLGISGEGKNLIDALRLINEEGWSAQQIMQAFGQRAGRAALILKDSLGDYKNFAETLKNSSGEAKKLADIMRDTLVGEFKTLKSVMESVAIDTFERYEDELRSAVKNTTEWIREHKDAIVDTFAAAKWVIETAIKPLQIWADLWQRIGFKVGGGSQVKGMDFNLPDIDKSLADYFKEIDSMEGGTITPPTPEAIDIASGLPAMGGDVTDADAKRQKELEDLVAQEEAKFQITTETWSRLDEALLERHGILEGMESQHAQTLVEIEANKQARILALEQSAGRSRQQIIKSIGSGILGMVIKDSKALFAVTKALEVGQAVMAAYAASNLALAHPPGPPSTIPLAAAVLKTGLLNAAAIAATGFAQVVASGGGGATGGGTYTSPAVTTPSGITDYQDTGEKKETLTINIQGDFIGDEAYIEMLAEKISEAVEDKDVTLIASNSQYAEALT